MGIAGSRHRNGAVGIAHTIAGLIRSRIPGLFVLEVWRESASVNHEIGYYAMIDRAIQMAAFGRKLPFISLDYQRSE